MALEAGAGEELFALFAESMHPVAELLEAGHGTKEDDPQMQNLI
jgi:hypothetical protein